MAQHLQRLDHIGARRVGDDAHGLVEMLGKRLRRGVPVGLDAAVQGCERRLHRGGPQRLLGAQGHVRHRDHGRHGGMGPHDAAGDLGQLLWVVGGRRLQDDAGARGERAGGGAMLGGQGGQSSFQIGTHDLPPE